MPCTGVTTTPPADDPGTPDVTPPAAPNGLVGVGNAVSGNRLTWNPNLEADLAGYNVYSSSTLNGVYTKLNSALLTQPTYNDAAATNGVTTYYRVYALDKSGNVSPPAGVGVLRPNVVILAPAAPTGVSAAGTASGIQLAWIANVETNIAGYHVSRGLGSGGPFTAIGPALITTLGWIDVTATPLTTYYYVVYAQNTSNLSSVASSVVHATAADVTPPAAPIGPVATGGVSNAVITWSANVESDLAGYNVYSSGSASGVFTKINIALITAGTQTYTDSTIAAGQTLYYRVTAVDSSSNESSPSAIVNATRTPNTTSPLTIVYNGGESPAVVFASLWAASVPNGRAQRECRYVWNAGDPGSDYNAVTCGSPMFTHVYLAPGTYTITCTRIDPNQNQINYSKQVTVSTSTRKTLYVDSTAGNDASNGLTSAAPLKTIAGVIPKIMANTTVLFARGQQHNLTGVGGQNIPCNLANLLFRDYGDATLPKPIISLQMASLSGELTGGKDMFVFGKNTSHVRMLNLRFDSNAISGNYTKGGFKTGLTDPTLGAPAGRGLAWINCDVGNVGRGFYATGVPSFWLLQKYAQIVGGNIPNHFCWCGSGGGGVSQYGAMLGCTQLNVTSENGTRFADDGVQYLWIHDCTLTTHYKAALDLRCVKQFAITNSRGSGAPWGLSPRDNTDAVRDGVYENCLLSSLSHFSMPAPGVYDVDFKNCIIDMGTDASPCIDMNTNQGPYEVGVGFKSNMFNQNIRWIHCTFKLAAPSSKCFKIQIGSLRDTTSDAIVGKNNFTGFQFINCLIVGPITKKSSGSGIYVINDNLRGTLFGVAKCAGNCWPVVSFDALSHPATLGTDATHYINAPVTNDDFAKFPAVSAEHYLQLALGTSYRATGTPTSLLEPSARYDFDGNLRTVTSGKVTVGAKQ